MNRQPAITHVHVWDGITLPAWLAPDRYSRTGDQLSVHGPDGATPIRPGWVIVLWSDGQTTVGSPTAADRVYGPDGLAGRLQNAEATIERIRQLVRQLRVDAASARQLTSSPP